MTVGTDAVTVYTSPTWPWCTRAKEFLRQKGVPFQERNVALDPAAAEEVVRRSGQMGVPVITAADEVIVGFDRPRLERLAGRLAPPPPPDPARRPRIGLRVKDAAGGAEVDAVHPGSPAEQAGLRVGDIVVEMNGQSVRSAADVESALAGLTAGVTIAVQVRRGSKQARLRMPLE